MADTSTSWTDVLKTAENGYLAFEQAGAPKPCVGPVRPPGYTPPPMPTPGAPIMRGQGAAMPATGTAMPTAGAAVGGGISTNTWLMIGIGAAVLVALTMKG